MQQRAGGHEPEGGSTAAGGTIQLPGPGLQHQRLHRRMLAHAESNALGSAQILR